MAAKRTLAFEAVGLELRHGVSRRPHGTGFMPFPASDIENRRNAVWWSETTELYLPAVSTSRRDKESKIITGQPLQTSGIPVRLIAQRQETQTPGDRIMLSSENRKASTHRLKLHRN